MTSNNADKIPPCSLTYDANGSLLSNGVSTYTYDSANRLIEVSNQSLVASMEYNGLGQRLSMTAASVTTEYVMDGNNPLTADAGGNVTTYLYGLGAVAEKTIAWSYSLSDGTNTSRQLTNASGAVSLVTRYTPWGDALETYGTGDFTFGYYGGVMDAATGLLYVGNGQYYDPATGRFLTRDARPNQNNPYTPFDPMGMLFAPLGLLALAYGRKKKRSKGAILLVILSFVVVTGMTLSGCNFTATGTLTPTSSPTMPGYIATGTVVDENGNSYNGSIYVATPSAPSTPLAIPCPTPETTQNIFRLTGIDWEGSKLVFFGAGINGTTFHESTKQAILLAMDMIQRASGKTPENVVGWVNGKRADNQISFIPYPGDSYGGGFGNGRIDLLAADTPQYMSPEGLAIIVHELGHGVDESAGVQGGYPEPFSMHVNQYGSGWIGAWYKDNKTGLFSLNEVYKKEAANNYLTDTLTGLPAPNEDFASTFASVIIEKNINMGLMNFGGTADLSAYIRLEPAGSFPNWPKHAYVSPARKAVIETIINQ